jgi:hypothetical protein
MEDEVVSDDFEADDDKDDQMENRLEDKFEAHAKIK